MAFASILSQIKLLFGLLVIQLVWYILKQLFTSVLVKVVDIYLHFCEKLLIIDWVESWAKGLEVTNSPETNWQVFFCVMYEKVSFHSVCMLSPSMNITQHKHNVPIWLQSSLKLIKKIYRQAFSNAANNVMPKGGDHGMMWGLWTSVNTPSGEF